MNFFRIFIMAIVLPAYLVSNLQAAELFSLKGFSIGGGTLSPPLKLYQTDSTGDTNSIQFNFILKIDSYYALNDNWTLSFGAGAELPKSDEVGNKKYPFYFNTRLHYSLFNFDLFLGNMLYLQNQFGTGESVKLNNGTGMSEFYLPGDTHSARNWVIEIGGAIQLTPDIFIEPTILLINITNSLKRNMGYMVTINYYFDPRTWSTK